MHVCLFGKAALRGIIILGNFWVEMLGGVPALLFVTVILNYLISSFQRCLRIIVPYIVANKGRADDNRHIFRIAVDGSDLLHYADSVQTRRCDILENQIERIIDQGFDGFKTV